MAMIFDDEDIRRGLLGPVMREIAAALEAGVERSFDQETAPDGTKWPDLSETTNGVGSRACVLM